MTENTVQVIDSPVTIIPLKCYTKSEYARKIKKSPTWVDKLIVAKKLQEIPIMGGSFVIEPEELSQAV
jgi:hypothetical protein